jgi:hypothetical protein
MSIEREIAVALDLDEFVNAFAVNNCNTKILFISNILIKMKLFHYQ